MSETLYYLYSDLITKEHWKYYTMPDPNISILQDYLHAKSFLTIYLGKGGKSNLEIFQYIDHLTENRVLHIISVFILGILLYRKSNKLSNEINKEIRTIPTESTESPEERFKYIWMLTCLFHDFGYAVEDGTVSFTEKEYERCLKKMPKRPSGIPAVYNKLLLRQYNKFRKCRFGKNDHGIIGGIKLYSDLCELRKEKEAFGDGRYWKKTLENDFRIASWIVACHNIFFIKGTDRNVPCYKHFQLDKLIYSNQSREIQFNKNALFFLFCLVDSIEPLKKVFDIKQLKNIIIRFEDDSIILGYNKLCPVLFEDYKRTVLSLDDWLTDVSTDGTIITI